MNAGPDTSMTFGDLIARVARECHCAAYDSNGVAVAPTDKGDLAAVKESIWDGCDDFYKGIDPRDGRAHRWHFLSPVVSLTLSAAGTSPANINADPARYRLPWYVTAAPVGVWHWSGEDSGYTGQAQSVTPENVIQRHEACPTTGRPQLVAVRPTYGRATVQDRQGWELHVYPDPDQSYTLRARFPVWPRRMESLDERHLAGAPHDQAIVAFAVRAFKRRDKTDAAMLALIERRAAEAMAGSIELDLLNAPDTLGVLIDPSMGRAADPRYDASTRDITVNGVTVT